MWAEIYDTTMVEKRTNALKTDILSKRSKKILKGKVDGLKKLSTRSCEFCNLLPFKRFPYINHKISWPFQLDFPLSFYDASS